MGQAVFIGLMSGTSMDAVDAALLGIGEKNCHLLATHSEPLPGEIRSAIDQLCRPGHNEIQRMAMMDRCLGEIFARAAQNLLKAAGRPAASVSAIGSHGQTIRHHPPAAGELAYTLQIADPNTIAELTGITTIADFRRRDIAAGGEGAPLAPAFHAAAFDDPRVSRAIVNIGGIANVTLLNRGPLTGFDTGPGNTLMDAWIALRLNRDFDEDGAWAAGGRILEELLEQLLQHEFLLKPAPKSTGREQFNLSLLQNYPADEVEPQDIQATLAEFTAASIAKAIPGDIEEVYLCGGGTRNSHLVSRLRAYLPGRPVEDTGVLGIGPGWVEAAAFAWLASQTLNHLAGNVSSVTGASRECILGGIYPAGSNQEPAP